MGFDLAGTPFIQVQINLLLNGPLCVCHIQDILGETQVRTSKQLAYIKRNGLIDVKREGVWHVYSISEQAQPIIEDNIKYLANYAEDYPCFSEDLVEKAELIKELAKCYETNSCPSSVYECCNYIWEVR